MNPRLSIAAQQEFDRLHKCAIDAKNAGDKDRETLARTSMHNLLRINSMNHATMSQLIDRADKLCDSLRYPMSTAQRALITSALIEAHNLGEVTAISRQPSAKVLKVVRS